MEAAIVQEAAPGRTLPLTVAHRPLNDRFAIRNETFAQFQLFAARGYRYIPTKKKDLIQAKQFYGPVA
jgi:hypothetical protein